MKREVEFTEFGQLVEKRAKEINLTLPEVAHRCNTSYTTLRRKLEDHRGPSPCMTHILCDLLDIDHIHAHELLNWIPKGSAQTTAR